MKVTFLAVMPSPYVQDLFEELAKDERFELRVVYLEQVAPDTYWGEQVMPSYASVLPGRWYGMAGARIHYNPTVRTELAVGNPDVVVVVGYIGLTNQIAMRSLTARGKPWVFWGEVPGLNQRGRLGRLVRKLLQRPLMGAAGIAGVGSHAVAAYKQLLRQHGKQPIVKNIPYHCRLDDFESAGSQRQPSPTLRFLYCGQLIHRKGVDLLINAFAQLVLQHPDSLLTLVGEGPLRSELTKGLPAETLSRIEFAGFKPVRELPNIFAMHDVFVLPSRHDGWGVVVNQAIAAGMPVIATTSVGASNDLIVAGENGFRIPPGETNALFAAMSSFATERTLVGRFGAVSSRLAAKISLKQASTDWSEFLHESLNAVEVRV